jgi:hypothetical protein
MCDAVQQYRQEHKGKEISTTMGGRMKKGDYVIVRTCSAGVFAGTLVSRKGKEVELSHARRLWYWDGAASLSQLSQEGVKKPQNCKFPCEVSLAILTEAIELLPVTPAARQSIQEVPVWAL